MLQDISLKLDLFIFQFSDRTNGSEYIANYIKTNYSATLQIYRILHKNKLVYYNIFNTLIKL